MITAADELPKGWSLTRQGGAIVVESPTGASDGTFDYVTAYAKAPSGENRTLWRLADLLLGGRTATAPNPLAVPLEFAQTRLDLSETRVRVLEKYLAAAIPALELLTQISEARGEDGAAGRESVAAIRRVLGSKV